MTVRNEEERLGIVEMRVDALGKSVENLAKSVESRASAADVAEMKSDVKELVRGQHQMAVAFAVKAAKDDGVENTRGAAGVWVRSIIPWAISLLAVSFTVLHMILEEQAKIPK